MSADCHQISLGVDDTIIYVKASSSRSYTANSEKIIPGELLKQYIRVRSA